MIGYDLPLYLYIPTINMTVRLESSTTLTRIHELTLELEVARKDRDEQQDTLNKEITAVVCIKNELNTKMSQVTIEKIKVMKHLRYISKSRQELEKTLATELKLVEKTRYDLQQVVKESNTLQKQKEENEVLMREIERITKATSKERKELESETDELKKFEDEIHQLKQSNEVTRQSLEQEKKQLTEFASEMLTKKSILMEALDTISTDIYERKASAITPRYEISFLISINMFKRHIPVKHATSCYTSHIKHNFRCSHHVSYLS